MWGGAEYEQIARRFASIHDGLVSRLAPREKEDWLDVATGTGEVALRAARGGAQVTGFDLSPGLLAQARAKAEEEGLEIGWELGTAEDLPYEDGSFDVVSSCFGIIFAPDHEAVARELARVCRPTGRLGLCNWRPNEGLHAIYSQFAPDEPEQDPEGWGREEHIEALLGGAFELEIEEREWRLEGESPQAVWELMSVGAPPVKALLDSLEPEARDQFQQAMLEYWGGFRTDGGVSEPRRYLLVFGTRR
jgi:SAM-dependent methyltransferase